MELKDPPKNTKYKQRFLTLAARFTDLRSNKDRRKALVEIDKVLDRHNDSAKIN